MAKRIGSTRAEIGTMVVALAAVLSMGACGGGQSESAADTGMTGAGAAAGATAGTSMDSVSGAGGMGGPTTTGGALTGADSQRMRDSLQMRGTGTGGAAGTGAGGTGAGTTGTGGGTGRPSGTP